MTTTPLPDFLITPEREAEEKSRVEAEKALGVLGDLVEQTHEQHADFVTEESPGSDYHVLQFADGKGGKLIVAERFGWRTALLETADGEWQHYGRFYSGKDYCLMVAEEGTGLRRATRNDVRAMRKFTKENPAVPYEQGSAPNYPVIFDPR